jgi:PTS system ascorbate-specific IIA component
MVGILLLTHYRIGHALLEGAAHVVGRALERCEAIAVDRDDDPVQVLEVARGLLATLDEGDGVLVLADLFGASPANVASQLAEPGRVTVLTGVNLPMLVRSVCYRQLPLAQVVDKALEGARNGIKSVESGEP